MKKDIISMEQKQCPYCGKVYDSNVLLLQTKGINKPKLDMKTLTGLEPCKECNSIIDNGYMFLVEISNKQTNNTIKQEDANRTGKILQLKKEVAMKLFDSDLTKYNMVFVNKEAVEKITDIINDKK